MKRILPNHTIVVIGLVAVALLIRIVYIHELSDNPFFNYPVVDSATYDDMAVRIAAGEAPSDEPFFQPPLYPFFLGLLYSIFGREFFAVRFAQMILGVLNVVLCYEIARRIFTPRIAIVSGLIFALYGTNLFFEGELLAPVLIIFLNQCIVLCFLAYMRKRTWGWAFATGLFTGLSSITMAVILPFAAVLMIYAWMRRNRDATMASQRQFLWHGIAFMAGIILCILPVTLYNASQGDAALISTNAGINMFIGTGDDYDRKVAIRPGFEWQALGNLPIRAGYRKPTEQSKYFIYRSLDLILDDPLGYGLLLVKKLFLYLHGDEILRNQEIYPFRGYSPLLSLLIWKHVIAFPYGFFAPLGLLGLILMIRNRTRRAYPLILFIISHVAALLPFFIAARYRMNVLPFIIICAIYAAYELYLTVRDRKYKDVISYGVVLCAFLIISNWRVGAMSDVYNADAYYNLGVGHMKEESPDAIDLYRQAIELDPDYPEANSNLGAMLDQRGNHEEAIQCFSKVLDAYPDDIETNINYGNSLFNTGDIQGARRQFMKVLDLDPDNNLALNNLRIVESRLSSISRDTLQEKQPGNEIFPFASPRSEAIRLINLSSVLLSEEKYAEAAEMLRSAIRYDDSFPQAYNNLGIALAESGDEEGAIQAFSRALELDPSNASAKSNLKRMNEKH